MKKASKTKKGKVTNNVKTKQPPASKKEKPAPKPSKSKSQAAGLFFEKSNEDLTFGCDCDSFGIEENLSFSSFHACEKSSDSQTCAKKIPLVLRGLHTETSILSEPSGGQDTQVDSTRSGTTE